MQAIFTNSGTSAGLGFAIGVDTVRRVVPQLIASGRVVRASLGIQASTACLCSSRLITVQRAVGDHTTHSPQSQKNLPVFAQAAACRGRMKASANAWLAGQQVAKEAVARTLKIPSGAMVQSVAAGGAGERAGLLPPRRSLGGILPGDVVTAVDGTGVAKPGAPMPVPCCRSVCCSV